MIYISVRELSNSSCDGCAFDKSFKECSRPWGMHCDSEWREIYIPDTPEAKADYVLKRMGVVTEPTEQEA